MDSILYWLAHCDDNGYLSLTAICVFIILLTVWVVKYIFGGNE